MKKEGFIRVYAIDDNPLHCAVLECCCVDVPFVSFTCFNSIQGLRIFDREPDLVLVNLNHHSMCPRFLIGSIEECYPDIPIIGYASSFDKDAFSNYHFLAPRGLTLMTYGELHIQLGEFMRSVQTGSAFPSCAREGSEPGTSELLSFMALSPKEKDVFCLMGKGFGPAEISEEVGCGVRTVETHLRKVRDRLKLTGQYEMRKSAIRLVNRNDCHVFSKSADHHCPHTQTTVGHCPFLSQRNTA
jgi:DNA-binding NarL/FixJ family response regulator